QIAQPGSMAGGFSDRLFPGSVASLANSSNVAFHAEFPDDRIPRLAAMYWRGAVMWRSEEHTSELQSRFELVCRLLLEKKKNFVERWCSMRGPPWVIVEADAKQTIKREFTMGELVDQFPSKEHTVLLFQGANVPPLLMT